MAIWHYVHVKKYMFEVKNKVSSDYIKDLAHRQGIKRISRIGYSELVESIPPSSPTSLRNTLHTFRSGIRFSKTPANKQSRDAGKLSF